MELKEILKRFDIEVEMISHKQSGKSTSQAAEALSEAPDRILKSLLFKSKKGKYVAAIVPGDRRVDLKKIERYFEERGLTEFRKLGMANAQEVKDELGYEVGGVPPFAFYRKCPTFYDKSLLQKEYVIGAGGNEFTGIKFDPKELKKLGFLELAVTD